MNKILILIFLFSFSYVRTQEIDTCFTQEEIIKLSTKIDNLKRKNELCDTIISVYREQILKYEYLEKLNNEKIIFKDSIYVLLREQNNLLIEQNKLNKLNWYEKPEFVFPSGIVLGILIMVVII